jgi:hypothetical protein
MRLRGRLSLPLHVSSPTFQALCHLGSMGRRGASAAASGGGSLRRTLEALADVEPEVVDFDPEEDGFDEATSSAAWAKSRESPRCRREFLFMSEAPDSRSASRAADASPSRC